MELDETDRKILKLLEADARLSYRDIAKALGVSHAHVSARVKRLEDGGVIRGYAAVVNPDAAGAYTLCLRVSAAQGADLAEVGSRFSEFPELRVVMRVSGDCELLGLAVCDNRESALRLLAQLGKIEGVGKVESHIVLESHKLLGFRL